MKAHSAAPVERTLLAPRERGKLRKAEMRSVGLFSLARFGLACSLAACGGRSERLLPEGERGGAGSGNEAASVCGVTSNRASAGFEIVFADQSQRISHLAEREDGSLIGFRNRELVRIDREGRVGAIELAPALAAALSGQKSVVLAPHGRAALVAIDTSERLVFDLDEPHLLSSFRAPDGLHLLSSAFSGSGELVTLIHGELGLYHSYPASLEVRRIDGSVVSSSLYRGERDPHIPASDDRMVWPPGANGEELLVTTLNGTDLYSVHVPSEVGALRLSADGRVIAMHLYGNELWHLIDGALLPPYLPDATLSELALAPGGRWTAFSHTAPGRVHLFEAGEWRTGAALTLDSVDDLDVSDYGDVVVGGESDNGERGVLLLDANLELQFTCAGPPSETYGPLVRFTRDGRRVIALFEDRLSVFGVR
jgi:hypothetical protein